MFSRVALLFTSIPYLPLCRGERFMCSTTTGGRNSLQKQFNPNLLSTASPAGVTSECHTNRKKNAHTHNAAKHPLWEGSLPLCAFWLVITTMCKCKSDFYCMTAWWVLPVQERVRAVGGHVTCVLSHAGWGHRVLSAAILLHAGRQLVSQGELLYAHAQMKECVSKCEIHKVSRLGLQERKL